jgi:alpha-L-fucosidase
MKTLLLSCFTILVLVLNSCNVNKPGKDLLPSSVKNEVIKSWENLRFGAFVHFNDNTFLEKEFSRNTDAKVFNPGNINFDGMMETFREAGVKYAVLTTRHTSGFCLWDSQVTEFDVKNSLFPRDVVKLFTESCRKYNIKPCLYYCLWGNDGWNPAKWNPVIEKELSASTAKKIILTQLTELASNYGDIEVFWLDMQCWADTSLKPQETYNLLKRIQPKTIVHFNQHVQDGTSINYFPTDILNGEERIPPVNGHQPIRNVGTSSYYLPFEYEITSQRCDHRTLGNGLMSGSVWFTYYDSQFYPVDSLYKYIEQSYLRGGSNVLLSTAPDKSGSYRKADSDSIVKLGRLIYQK